MHAHNAQARGQDEHTVRAIDDSSSSTLSDSATMRRHRCTPSDEASELAGIAPPPTPPCWTLFCTQILFLLLKTKPLGNSEAFSVQKILIAKGKVAERGLCGCIPRILDVRVHKMLNGSLRRAVIGLSLVGMLTGASAFSVMPALRPANLRSSSHAGRPTSL